MQFPNLVQWRGGSAVGGILNALDEHEAKQAEAEERKLRQEEMKIRQRNAALAEAKMRREEQAAADAKAAEAQKKLIFGKIAQGGEDGTAALAAAATLGYDAKMPAAVGRMKAQNQIAIGEDKAHSAAYAAALGDEMLRNPMAVGGDDAQVYLDGGTKELLKARAQEGLVGEEQQAAQAAENPGMRAFLETADALYPDAPKYASVPKGNRYGYVDGEGNWQEILGTERSAGAGGGASGEGTKAGVAPGFFKRYEREQPERVVPFRGADGKDKDLIVRRGKGGISYEVPDGTSERAALKALSPELWEEITTQDTKEGKSGLYYYSEAQKNSNGGEWLAKSALYSDYANSVEDAIDPATGVMSATKFNQIMGTLSADRKGNKALSNALDGKMYNILTGDYGTWDEKLAALWDAYINDERSHEQVNTLGEFLRSQSEIYLKTGMRDLGKEGQILAARMRDSGVKLNGRELTARQREEVIRNWFAHGYRDYIAKRALDGGGGADVGAGAGAGVGAGVLPGFGGNGADGTDGVLPTGGAGVNVPGVNDEKRANMVYWEDFDGMVNGTVGNFSRAKKQGELNGFKSPLWVSAVKGRSKGREQGVQLHAKMFGTDEGRGAISDMVFGEDRLGENMIRGWGFVNDYLAGDKYPDELVDVNVLPVEGGKVYRAEFLWKMYGKGDNGKKSNTGYMRMTIPAGGDGTRFILTPVNEKNIPDAGEKGKAFVSLPDGRIVPVYSGSVVNPELGGRDLL